MSTIEIHDISELNNVPDNVTTIIFNDNFNQPIDSLKNLTNLTQISFGRYFKQPITSLKNLTNLTHMSLTLIPRHPFNIPSNLSILRVNGNKFNNKEKTLDKIIWNFSKDIIGEEIIIANYSVEFRLNGYFYYNYIIFKKYGKQVNEKPISRTSYNEVEQFLLQSMAYTKKAS